MSQREISSVIHPERKLTSTDNEQETYEEDNIDKKELEMSLCNHLFKEGLSEEERHIIFNKHLVTFKDFDRDPYSKLFNPQLCFRIEDNIVMSQIAIPQIISLLAFNKEISNNALSSIMKTNFLPLNQSNNLISKIPPSKYYLILITCTIKIKQIILKLVITVYII